MTERLGPPPDPLPGLRLADIFEIPTDALIGRIYFASGPYPARWDSFREYGPVASMRFDHHPSPPGTRSGRSIAYATPNRGSDGRRIDPFETCVIECFSATRTIDTRFNEPWFVLWRPGRPILLLDLVESSWLVRAGGNAAISSGPRPMARHWSRAIYETYADVAGIYYQSSNLPRSRCVALYERANRAVPARYEAAFPLTHPLLRPALHRLAYDFDWDLVL